MALRDRAHAREVDDGMRTWAGYRFGDGARVPQIDMGRGGRASGAIDPCDLVTGFLEKPAQVGSDETVGSDHQNAHEGGTD